MQAKMIGVSPLLPAADIEAAIAFYVEKLGFTLTYRDGTPAGFANLNRDDIQLHLYAHAGRDLAEATSLRIQVEQIDQLYAHCSEHRIVHPNGALATRPWGTREFATIDPSGVCITFFQR